MSNVLYPNKQEFDELIKNDKVLVDFFADKLFRFLYVFVVFDNVLDNQCEDVFLF